MANIRDVARSAGVSVSSVSNVLNGRTDQMRKETLLRIEAAMVELNYHPNRAAQQLKTGQAKMIGLLVPSIVNPSFAALAREVDLAAKNNHGYRVLLGNTYRQEDEEQAFLNDLMSHGVRGVIVVSSSIEKSHFAEAAQRGLTMVNYDGSSVSGSATNDMLYDSVSMDNRQAGRIAAQYLIDQGCREIAFVTEASRTVSRSHKIEGFLATAAENGLKDHSQVIEGKALTAYGDTEMAELGHHLAQTISRLEKRPNGIVAINDVLAIGLIAGLRSLGVRVPEDISVVGIDNISLSGLIHPALTSVAPPLADMANTMVERLITRLNAPQTNAEEFLFTPTLVIRDSVIKRNE
ncbi:LacI family DNA-binding transcriptional regulator [Pragia fontium]|uniref:DNA-binding transcriptional regulator, LacI/PurR family n=1 Tax=Pragia fontium DSM 5563 = ATCC 49100 TaxID=1122977 RepID=A0AAJ4W7Y5_9GAMM|nr:LacI family DNA-binding transcriptional regulator [Pragia fontium]SFC07375.1 DNA-binding transcriptional regulator, LacI/PurR family [Pragia fontium DSM 5563 = ATCC 49100]SUB81491.1 Ribose operon repressor [Pragia fontium]VEJ53841.1 Ribose operon repressor [Pragia fontium]